MIRTIIHTVIWLVLIAWFTVIMGFVTRNNESMLCRQIEISIEDSTNIRFVTSDMLREVIYESGINTQGYPIETIDTRRLEKLLEKDPYVYNAEVFVNIEGDLKIDIKQRQPLLRIMPGGKNGFYIDQEGIILPLSQVYSPMVLLVTGNIRVQEQTSESGLRLVDLKNDPEIVELLNFASFVKDHDFWNRQIVQLYRDKKGSYEIIPRVGAHQIQLGTLDGFKIKLQNLKLLYEQGLQKYGWNSYDKINLKYSNQIICTKR